MNCKNHAILALFFLCVFFLTGCHQLLDPQAGKEPEIPKKPMRVIGGTLSADEVLLSVLPPERLLAVTKYADDPGVCTRAEEAKKIPYRHNMEPEKIIELQPDLVVLASWQPAELRLVFRDAGIPVYLFDTPHTVEGVRQMILGITEATGDAEKGKAIVQQMDAELAEVKAEIGDVPEDEQPIVLWQTLMGSAGAKGTLFDDMTKYASVVNGAAKAGMHTGDLLPKEAILEVDPDILLMPTWDWTGKGKISEARQQLVEDPALANVKAIKNERFEEVPEKYLYACSQSLVKGVRIMAAIAYPDRVKRGDDRR